MTVSGTRPRMISALGFGAFLAFFSLEAVTNGLVDYGGDIGNGAVSQIHDLMLSQMC